MPHNPEALGFVMRITITVMLLAMSWRFMLVQSLNDLFRQRLFEIRHELLRLVVDGHIVPEHQAYRGLRTTINGLIQYAERITIIRYILMSKYMPLNCDAYSERREEALSKVDDKFALRELVRHHDQLDYEIARHMLFTTPELWPVFVIRLVRTMSIAAAKSPLATYKLVAIEAEASECAPEALAA